MSEDFDPEAYLRAKRAEQEPFDPEAYLGTKRQPETEQPGHFASRTADLVQQFKEHPIESTLTYVNPFSGVPALQAQFLLPDSAKDSFRDLLRTGRHGMTLGLGRPAAGAVSALSGEGYDKGAQEQERAIQESEARSPYPSAAGTLLGTVAAPLPKIGALQGAKGLPAALGRIGISTGIGSGVGALSSAAGGGDALEGAKWGAAGGFLGGGLGEGVRLAAPPLARALRAFGIKRASDVIQGGSDIAAATRKPLSEAAAEEALTSGAIQPMWPFSEGVMMGKGGATTGATYNRLEKLAEAEGKRYAQVVADFEARGVKGPEAKALADQLFERYAQEWPKAPASKAVPQRFFDEAANVEAISQGKRNLGLGQSEALKSNLQHAARFERLQNSPTEEATQEISSIVRQANEDAIIRAAEQPGASEELKQLATSFVPIKQRAGRLIEARTAAERGASKAAQRQTIGLKDAIFGAATGNPAAAYGTALASSAIRNRLPSTLATGAYGASRSLQSPMLPAAAAGSATALWANAMQDDEKRAKLAALIEALRGQPAP